MMNPTPPRTVNDTRYRGLVIIWGAVLLAIFMFIPIMILTSTSEPNGGANRSLLTALAVLALGAFVLSFVMKSQFIKRAVADRRPDAITSGYIVAFALCELSAVMGFATHFVYGARESYYFFVPAAFGLLLHFPRRAHLDDVTGDAAQTFKTTF